MEKPIRTGDALQALENLFDFCEEIDLHLPDEEKTGYKMFPDYLLVNQYIKDNKQKHGCWISYNPKLHDSVYEGMFMCCECKSWVGSCTNYCPVCGTKNGLRTDNLLDWIKAIRCKYGMCEVTLDGEKEYIDDVLDIAEDVINGVLLE